MIIINWVKGYNSNQDMEMNSDAARSYLLNIGIKQDILDQLIQKLTQRYD